MERALVGEPFRPAALLDFSESSFYLRKSFPECRGLSETIKPVLLLWQSCQGHSRITFKLPKNLACFSFPLEKYVIIDNSGQNKKPKIRHSGNIAPF